MRNRRIHRIAGSYSALGETFPVDYAFAGARINYDATAYAPDELYPGELQAFSSAQMEQMRLGVTSTFDVSAEQDEPNSGSIHFEFATRNDFGSIRDIKALIDGIAYSSGIVLRASMARFISNPRRDGTAQPPGNTPGADPRYTTVPPSGVDTTKPGDALSTAGSFWFPQLDSLAASIGLDSNTLVIVAAVGVIFLMKR